jgi:hypothetical protein
MLHVLWIVRRHMVFGLNFEDKLKLILVHDPSLMIYIEVLQGKMPSWSKISRFQMLIDVACVEC